MKVGDKFKRVGGAFDGDIYEITESDDGKCFLKNVRSGCFWSNKVKVNDKNNINESEFRVMDGNEKPVPGEGKFVPCRRPERKLSVFDGAEPPFKIEIVER
jgi:hypothetical protein